MELLKDAAQMMGEQRYGLLVVDSVTSLFRKNFPGEAMLAEQLMQLEHFMHGLLKLADEVRPAFHLKH